MTVHVSTHTKQVSKLAKLYEDGQVSDATARTLNKVVDFEVHQLQTGLAATEKDMGEFEQQYGMSTEDFFRQWQAGPTTVWITLNGRRWRKWRKICVNGWNFLQARRGNGHCRVFRIGQGSYPDRFFSFGPESLERGGQVE
jgi:hypothetical protein